MKRHFKSHLLDLGRGRAEELDVARPDDFLVLAESFQTFCIGI